MQQMAEMRRLYAATAFYVDTYIRMYIDMMRRIR